MLQNGQSSLRDCIDTPKVGVNNPQKESQILADSMLFFAIGLFFHAESTFPRNIYTVLIICTL